LKDVQEKRNNEIGRRKERRKFLQDVRRLALGKVSSVSIK